MKSLELRNGDLVVGVNNDYATVTGPAKVQQDLRCALLEPLGNDRFHPGYGSQLDDFVGLLADESTAFEVRQEVQRIVTNYSAVQRDLVQRDSLSGQTSRFSTDEVVTNVVGVDAQIREDSILVGIRLAVASGQAVIVEEIV